MNRKAIDKNTLFFLSLFFSIVLCIPALAGPCGDCHKSPPNDAAHTLHSGLKELTPVYGSLDINTKSPREVSTYGFNCGHCHPEDESRHRNDTVDIALERTVSGLKHMNASDVSFDGKRKTCSGVYCHSSGGSAPVQYRETPSWSMKERVEERCQGCHGSPPSYPGTADQPNGHFNSVRGSGHLLGIHWDSTEGHSRESFKHDTASQMGCSTCHYDTVREEIDTTFVDRVNGLFTCGKCHKKRNGKIHNRSFHVNGIVDIAFPDKRFRSKAQLFQTPPGWKRIKGTGKPVSCDETIDPLDTIRFDPETKTCSNVACHLFQENLTWGSKIDCSSCHAHIKKALH